MTELSLSDPCLEPPFCPFLDDDPGLGEPLWFSSLGEPPWIGNLGEQGLDDEGVPGLDPTGVVGLDETCGLPGCEVP